MAMVNITAPALVPGCFTPVGEHGTCRICTWDIGSFWLHGTCVQMVLSVSPHSGWTQSWLPIGYAAVAVAATGVALLLIIFLISRHASLDSGSTVPTRRCRPDPADPPFCVHVHVHAGRSTSCCCMLCSLPKCSVSCAVRLICGAGVAGWGGRGGAGRHMCGSQGSGGSAGFMGYSALWFQRSGALLLWPEGSCLPFTCWGTPALWERSNQAVAAGGHGYSKPKECAVLFAVGAPGGAGRGGQERVGM
jgi:hypothetical protein